MPGKRAAHTRAQEPNLTLLTPGEVATKLRVDERTLANWRYRGCGPVYMRLGGLIRYSTSDLENFLVASRYFMTQHKVPNHEGIRK